MKRGEQCLDLRLENYDRLFQVRDGSKMLAQQEPMMRSDLAVQRRHQCLV